MPNDTGVHPAHRVLGWASLFLGIGILTSLFFWAPFAPFILASFINDCGFVLYGTYPSPSGNKALVLFDEECSFMGDPVIQGSMAPSLDDFLERRPESFFSAVGMIGPDIRVVWRDDTHLLIAMAPYHERGKLGHRVGDVVIEYE